MLERTNKNNPCPICSGVKSCSFDLLNNRYMCRRTHCDTEGFTYLRDAGGFGILKKIGVKGAGVYSGGRSSKTQKATRKSKLVKPSLPVLSSEISQVLKSLTLSSSHRKDLTKRGLTEEQISKGLFKSIKYGQKTPATGLAPGFDAEGVWRGVSGMICPSFSSLGQPTGYQIKSDQPGLLGKYVWSRAYKDKDKKQVLNTAHIDFFGKATELPITCCVKERKPGLRLYICEGILKPFIIHSRFGVNVIGAAGGLFESFQAQFTYLLTTLSPSEVIYMADAGCGVNSDVMREMTKANDLVKSTLGSEMLVSDYGQHLSKDNLDGDEIDDFTFQTLGKVPFSNFVFSLSYDENAHEVIEEILTSYDVKGFDESLIDNVISGEFTEPEQLWSPLLNKCRPGIYYTPETHQTLLATAYKLGYKYLLDVSGTGSGKSFLTGKLSNEAFIAKSKDGNEIVEQIPDSIFYFSSQHRSPSCEPLELRYTEHPTKNARLYPHPTKKTPLGQPILMRDKQDKKSRAIPGNCSRADLQQSIYEAGSRESACRGCEFFSKCSKEESPGSYGYRYQVQQALSFPRIRANIQGLNLAESVRDYDIAVIDEYSQTLPFVQSYTIDITNFLAEVPMLAAELGGHFKDLEVVQRIISGQYKLPIYGLNLGEYFKLHGRKPALLAFAQNVSDIQSNYNKEAAETDDVPKLEWCSDLLRALSGLDSNISLTFTTGKIAVYKKNTDLLATLDAFKMVVFMDATSTKQSLVEKLGCSPDEVLLISQKGVNLDHVTIKQVVSLGALGVRRTSDTIKKTEIVRDVLTRKYGKEHIGFIDWKRFSKSEDLNHFVDGRGSNLFKDKKAVVAFGVANTNVTAAKAIFEVIRGVKLTEGNVKLNRDFRAYYEALRQAEVEQEIGRLRASRREGEQLHFYSISNMNLRFLFKKGYNFEVVRGYDIDMEICSLKDKLLYAIKELGSAEEFRRMSIRQFSSFAKVAASSVSSQAYRVFKNKGGWYAYREMLIDLVFEQPQLIALTINKLAQGKKHPLEVRRALDLISHYSDNLSNTLSVSKDDFYSDSTLV